MLCDKDKHEMHFNALCERVGESLRWAARDADIEGSLEKFLAEFEESAQRIAAGLHHDRTSAAIGKAICLLLSEAGKYASLIDASRRD